MLNQVILSSHYFPCIAYFAHLVKYPDIIIDIGENFLKQSYRNRCIIYTSNGTLALSIPVIKKNNTPMKDVLIDVKEDWKTKHWRAISTAYNSSPFFEFYCDELKEVLFKEYSSLANLNRGLLEHICNELGITNNIIISETYITIKDSELDLRSTLNPKQTFKGSDTYPRYIQIFEAKYGFQSNLSILDLLFHEGPESLNYLTNLINH